MKKRWLILIILACLVLSGWLFRNQLLGLLKLGVESWVRSQILSLASDNINPELSFGRFQLRLPFTAIMHDAKLTAEGVDILSARNIEITLGEIPQRGKPILITEIILTEPSIELDVDSNGEVVGFERFIKEDSKKDDNGLPLAVSQILDIKLVQVIDGSFIYRSANYPDPQVINGLTFDLNSRHEDENDPEGRRPQRGREWFFIDAHLVRPDLFDIAMVSWFNIDTLVFDIDKFNMQMQVDESTDDILPPVLQDTISNNEISGKLQMRGAGQIDIDDLDRSMGECQIVLLDTYAHIGDLQVPIKTMDLQFWARDAAIQLNSMTTRTLGGQLGLHGRLDLHPPYKFELDFKASDINIHEAMAPRKDGTRSSLAGLADAQCEITGDTTGLPESIAGTGHLSIEDGNFSGTKLVEELDDSIKSEVTAPRGHDSAEIAFHFDHQRIDIDSFYLTSGFLGAHGHGAMWFDGVIDLRLNAGPLERVQHSLGAVGRLLRSVTDRIVTYRVSGKLNDPSLSILPLGVGGGWNPNRTAHDRRTARQADRPGDA
ncbi:MAG: hypothetical protein CMJ32_07295 [Phycisphaerae bacterium]|nr:hypothetical protein [Phycisphaerae bacterium]